MNGINGGLAVMKVGDALTGTTIVGQGDASLTHGGVPIELNNKSTGGWRENLDGSISTKSLDIDIELTVNDDADQLQLIADAFAGTAATYTFDFLEYNYSGTFTPVISSETAAKDTAVTLSMQFMSSGIITRSIPV